MHALTALAIADSPLVECFRSNVGHRVPLDNDGNEWNPEQSKVDTFGFGVVDAAIAMPRTHVRTRDHETVMLPFPHFADLCYSIPR